MLAQARLSEKVQAGGMARRLVVHHLLGRRGHVALDYLTAPALLLAGRALPRPASSAAAVFAALIWLAASTTRTPLGLVRVVPFAWHGRAELASVAVQFALPWLLGPRDRAGRRFWRVFAAYNLAVWLATDWRAAD